LDQIRGSETDIRSFYLFPLYGHKTRPAQNYASNSVLWPLFSTASQDGKREWRILHFLRLGAKISNSAKPVQPVSTTK
jgi:hypothetical protein